MFSTPWTEDYQGQITFGETTYADVHPSDPDRSVFYYGAAGPNAGKLWDLSDVTAAGEGVGNLWIWFGPDSSTTRMGAIDHVHLSTDQQHLSFWFHPIWSPTGASDTVGASLDRVPDQP